MTDEEARAELDALLRSPAVAHGRTRVALRLARAALLRPVPALPVAASESVEARAADPRAEREPRPRRASSQGVQAVIAAGREAAGLPPEEP